MKIQFLKILHYSHAYMTKNTFRIVQVQAIWYNGKDDKFPPAKYMLGNSRYIRQTRFGQVLNTLTI